MVDFAYQGVDSTSLSQQAKQDFYFRTYKVLLTQFIGVDLSPYTGLPTSSSYYFTLAIRNGSTDRIIDLSNSTDKSNNVVIGDSVVQNLLIKGGQGNDTLIGGLGSDTIIGGAEMGGDSINAGANNDLIFGGSTAALTFTMQGLRPRQGSFADFTSSLQSLRMSLPVSGGPLSTASLKGINWLLSANKITANSVSTVKQKIVAGDGDDTVVASGGNSFIQGGNGNDILVASNNPATLDGGSGDDLIFGNLGNDVLIAGTGNNTIFSGGGNDSITAGRGNDMIYTGSGSSVINLEIEKSGRVGRNIYIFTNPTGDASQTQTVNISYDSQMTCETVDVDNMNKKVTIFRSRNGRVSVYATIFINNSVPLLNQITINTTPVTSSTTPVTSYRTTIRSITTIIQGGDTYSGTGNDRFIADNTTATAFLTVNNVSYVGGFFLDGREGTNSYDATASDLTYGSYLVYDNDSFGANPKSGNLKNISQFKLGNYADFIDLRNYNLSLRYNVLLGDGNNIAFGSIFSSGPSSSGSLVGGTGNDSLTAGAYGDYLDGGRGTDTLIGGIGNDTLIFGTGRNSVVGDNGNDRFIFSGQDSGYTGFTFQSINNQSYSVSTAAAIVYNVVSGSYNGGEGADSFYGSSGNDVLIDFSFSAATSTGGNQDTIRASFSGIEYYNLGTGNDFVYFRQSVPSSNAVSRIIDGGVGDDYIIVDSGNNSLSGGLGNDTLKGGSGNDTLFGGLGSDYLTGGNASDMFVFTTDKFMVADQKSTTTITDFTNIDTLKFSSFKDKAEYSFSYKSDSNGLAYTITNSSTGARLDIIFNGYSSNNGRIEEFFSKSMRKSN